MSKNAIAFLTGLGTGYMNASEKDKKQKRDDEDRALRNEAAQLQIDAAKKTVSDQKTIAQAGLPVEMVQGAGGMVKPDAMDNRDVGLPENAALPDGGLDKGGYKVGQTFFSMKDQAAATVAQQNTPEERSKRVIAAMSGIDPVKAMDLEQTQTQRGREATKFSQEQEAYAKKLKDEGALDALKALRGGDGAGMVTAFNKGGQYKILGEPVVTPEAREIPGVGSVPTYSATFKVQGADGKPQDMTINSHDLGMRLMPYEKWFDTQLKASKEGREGRESDSKVGLHGAQAEYYRSAAGAKDAVATKSPYERMSEVDKTSLTSLNKQRDTINTAMTKAQAEGSWDDNAPGSKALKTKLAALTLQEAQLTGKYSDGGSAKPDPLGMRKPAASGDTGTRVAPGTQAARDGGRLEILNSELSAAQQRLSSGDPRAQGDIEALQREIGVTSKKAAPANAASAGVTLPSKPVVAPAAPAAPAARPVAATVAAQKPSLASAMGVKPGGAAIDKIVAEKVPVVQGAADGITKAKAALAAAAKSGDPQALQVYAAQVQEARNQFDALLKDMNPQQAEAVRQATGYYL